MILLTSSIASVARHLYDHYLIDKSFKTVLFIDTAAEIEIGKEDGDDDWLLADFQSLVDCAYKVNRYTITGKSKSEVKSMLDTHDILYMCGGNTLYLLSQLQKTEAFSLIQEQVTAGKPYIGTSAGSIVAGPKVPVYLEDSSDFQLLNDTGLNFINAMIVPHWGSKFFRETYLERGMQNAYQDSEPPFILLNDFQYICVNGDQFKIIDTQSV